MEATQTYYIKNHDKQFSVEKPYFLQVINWELIAIIWKLKCLDYVVKEVHFPMQAMSSFLP